MDFRQESQENSYDIDQGKNTCPLGVGGASVRVQLCTLGGTGFFLLY